MKMNLKEKFFKNFANTAIAVVRNSAKVGRRSNIYNRFRSAKQKALIMLKFVKIYGNILIYIDKGVQKDENAVSKQASKQASKGLYALIHSA